MSLRDKVTPASDVRRSTMLVFAMAALGLLAAPGRLHAQRPSLLSGFDPIGNARDGIHLYSVTGFVGWESVANPAGGFYLPNGATVRGDEPYGGSLSLGWARMRPKSTLSITYSASYLGQVRYSSLNALSHFLRLDATRQLNAKWSAGFSASSALTTYDQMLFSPTLMSSVVAVPGTFDDLASAVLAGKYTNNQLASLLTGSPVIESPARTVFFGNRLFLTSASASVHYAHSSRLSTSFFTTASLSQHLDDRQHPGDPQYRFLLPRAMTGSAGTSISYAWTPRTQVGVSASSSRGYSRFEDSYTTVGSAFIGRTMGQHWFAQLHGGGGFATPVRAPTVSKRGTSPVAGGNLGYKTYAQTFVGSYDRTLGQSFGVGAADITTIGAAWNWWRPGRRWGLSSGYMRQQFQHGAFGSINGWRTMFGATRRMGSHMVVETAYTYASYSNTSATLPVYDSAQHAVRLSLMWMPEGEERR